MVVKVKLKTAHLTAAQEADYSPTPPPPAGLPLKIIKATPAHPPAAPDSPKLKPDPTEELTASIKGAVQDALAEESSSPFPPAYCHHEVEINGGEGIEAKALWDAHIDKQTFEVSVFLPELLGTGTLNYTAVKPDPAAVEGFVVEGFIKLMAKQIAKEVEQAAYDALKTTVSTSIMSG